MSSSINTSTGPAATLGALAAAGEHTGWRVLDTARAQQFTGEIVFQTQPSISVYLDSGNAYYAVRTGDPSLCERLIEADVIAPAQIERGVIRVGNIENLGRLFDRDPSVDRDAVMVILELATDDVVTAVANAVTSSISLTAYRHHASGVHRWFVAPSDQQHHAPAQLAPVGEVAQIDASVTSDLPSLPGQPDDFDDCVQIEWNQPLGRDLLDAPLHALDESMLHSILDTPVGPSASKTPLVAPTVAADDPPLGVADVAPPAPLAPPELVVSVAAAGEVKESGVALHGDGSADNFQIVWPDGSEQALIGLDADVACTTPEHDAEPMVAEQQGAPEPEVPTSATIPESPVDDPPVNTPPRPSVIVPAEEIVPPAPEPAPISFELPALAVADDNLPEDHQPEEVVDAVRRALEAIESALAAPARLTSVAVADLPSFEPTTPLQFKVIEPLVVEPLVVESRSFDVADQPEPAPAAEPTIEAISAVGEPVTAPMVAPVAAVPAISALEAVLPPQIADAPDEVVVVPAPIAATVVVPQVVEAAPAPLAGFAPPTLLDSAEAVYARTADDALPTGPAALVASVVFVDEDADGDDDRSGALKRLIGSLRRK